MNESELLQILLGEFRDKLEILKNNIVIRDAQFPDAPNKIKVAMGMRRVGKTYFLYQYILKLLNEGADLTSILFINFEDDRLLPLDQQKLAKLIEAFYSLYPENHDRKCFLFLDEIQNVEGWPIVIRRFYDSKQVEIFLTGSSSKLLSKEIATNLRGRSLAIEIWPYSFNEYMRVNNVAFDKRLYDKKKQDKLMKIFSQYLTVGGFPEVQQYRSDVSQKTLQEYLDIVIYRDIIERHNVKNPSLIKYMILSMVYNVAKPFSINKFYNDLKSQGYSIGKDLLYEYANYIEDAYLTFSISVYDKSIRKTYANPKKAYAIDHGMMRALTLDYENDFGRLFENIIYLELRRLDCKINYYLTEERYEIDFLVHSPRGHKKLFQVAWNIDDDNVLAREKRALQAGMKELKIDGEIITLDSYLKQGIIL